MIYRRPTAQEKIRRYRVQFQTEHWPAVCEAQGWNPSDEIRRRDLRARCWVEIGRPDLGDSMPDDDALATALFTLCRHLADPDNLTLALRWDQCRANYRTFNRARQADHWERKAYGIAGSERIHRQRFQGKTSAAGYPAEDAQDKKATEDRLLTMRARAKGRKYQLHMQAA